MELDNIPAVFDGYTKNVRIRLLYLREIIYFSAKKLGLHDLIQETLRWGEPSFVVKSGSTLRLNQLPSSSGRYGLFFNCQSKLVDSFRQIYPDTFQYLDNRGIMFGNDQVIPEDELQHCITLALSYHKIKHLPLLGA